MLPVRLAGQQMKRALGDGHVPARRNHVDMIRLNPGLPRPTMTGMGVTRDGISAKTLECSGARCCTKTNPGPYQTEGPGGAE